LSSGEEEESFIPLPVVNLDPDGELSQALIAGINEAGGLRVVLYDQAEAQALLEEETFLKEDAVSRVLTIPAHFSSDFLAGRQTTLQLVNHPNAGQLDSETVNSVVTGVAQDMTLQRQLIASLEQMGEMQAASPAGSQTFTPERIVAQAQDQWDRSQERPLISVTQVEAGRVETEDPLANTPALNITVPGLTILFVFTAAQYTARSIFDEKRIGSFRRLLAAPMSKAALLAGKMLPNFVTVLFQIALLFAIAIFLLPLLGMERMTLGNDPLALLLLSIMVAFCSTSLGIVIAAIARSENQVGGLGTLVLWGMGLIGGSMIPPFLLPDFLKSLGSAVPQSWAINAYHTLFVFGGGLADITAELAALLGFTVLFTLFGLWKFDFD